ncbi:hypothetical protein ABPG77_003411 [Micractinium sp. CCAP 211/92]
MPAGGVRAAALRAHLWLAALAAALQVYAADNSARTAASGVRPRLLFSDEFNGTEIDRSKWDPQVGNGCQYNIPGWGNAERQWYTDLPANLAVRRGSLVLQAVRDSNPGTAPQYTSARVRTFGQFGVAPSAAYPLIRIQARIKVPQGLGLWSAFWMLPEDGSYASCSGCGRYGGWANSGEIDIMEIANTMQELKGTLHFGGMWPYNTYSTGTTSLPAGRPFSDAFHVYSLEWERSEMRWYVDGRLFYTMRSSGGNKTSGGWFSLQPCTGDACWAAPARGGSAPFDRRFHLVLNLALGSEATGFTMINGQGIREDQLAATLAQPKQMLVDWVRVWGVPPGA